MIQVEQDSTGVSLEVLAVDAVTGQPRPGLRAEDVTLHYLRTRGSITTVAMADLGAPDAAHVDGGFVEIDGATVPGWYRVDLPNASLVSGAAFVTVVLRGSDVLITPLRVALVVASGAETAAEVHLCKAALVNQRVHTISTGAHVILDDDGATPLVTLTPTAAGDDTIAVVPS